MRCLGAVLHAMNGVIVSCVPLCVVLNGRAPAPVMATCITVIVGAVISLKKTQKKNLTNMAHSPPVFSKGAEASVLTNLSCNIANGAIIGKKKESTRAHLGQPLHMNTMHT